MRCRQEGIVRVMESTRFDSLSRHLGSTSTRRGTFRGIAAAGLGLGLAGIGIKSAAAKKKLNARCKKSDECGGGLKCQKSNSQNSCYAKTEKRCCKPVGSDCSDGCDCCGVDVICNGGYCDKA